MNPSISAILNNMPEFDTTYSAAKNAHDNHVNTNKILLLITKKCCNYHELISMYKNQTLADLYKTAHLQFISTCDDNSSSRWVRMFLDSECTIEIPNTCGTTVYKYFAHYRDTRSDIVSPEYPIPAPVVYKIYYTTTTFM